MKLTKFTVITVLPVVFFFCLCAKAQDSTFAEKAVYRNAVIVPLEEGHFILEFTGPDLLESSFVPGQISGDSLVANMENGKADLQLRTSAVTDSLFLTSEGIEFKIEKEPFEITYYFEQPWIDFRSGRKYIQGSSLKVFKRENLIPKLVKSGAIIPVLQEEKEMIKDNLQFHFFYDRNVKQNLLNTCENSYNLEFPECIKIKVESGVELLVDVSKEMTSEANETGEVEVIIHDLDRPVNFVWVNGIKYTGKNYAHDEKLIVPVRFDTRERTEIRIIF